jgi:hypothetical protein
MYKAFHSSPKAGLFTAFSRTEARRLFGCFSVSSGIKEIWNGGGESPCRLALPGQHLQLSIRPRQPPPGSFGERQRGAGAWAGGWMSDPALGTAAGAGSALGTWLWHVTNRRRDREGLGKRIQDGGIGCRTLSGEYRVRTGGSEKGVCLLRPACGGRPRRASRSLADNMTLCG